MNYKDSVKLISRRAAIGLTVTTLVMGFTLELSASQISPYVHNAKQLIKSLTAKEISDLQSGNGVGFAKAAELNHYPGPRHVLDLANELSLTDFQEKSAQMIFKAMKERAVELGYELVEQERILNEMFKTGSVNPARLSDQLNAIGQIKTTIRYVHLNAHLAQTDILTPDQVKQYDLLRGYNDSKGTEKHGSHAH